MVSDTAHVERLSSRRRVRWFEIILLFLGAMALLVGAVAWITNVDAVAPFFSAVLPSDGGESSPERVSFNERFLPVSGEQRSPDSSRQLLDRSVSAFRFKLRDAKELLAQKLRADGWRTRVADEDPKPTADTKSAVEGVRPSTVDIEPSVEEARTAAVDVKPDEIPLPRSRPVQANLATLIASSQAYAEASPKVDTKADNRTVLQKLGGLFPGKMTFASLTPDSGLFGRGPDLAALGYDSKTAVYDISARAVYLPSGVAIEAHSGMGTLKDDPGHVDQRMVGATPPATYDLRPREQLFHGVRALRMIPADGSNPHGRTGLLTHSYMLGPEGDSNGCVSIKFYERFLKAYDDGEINRLVVVPSLKGSASISQRASSDS